MVKYQICATCKKETTEGVYHLNNSTGAITHYHASCVNPTQLKSKTGRFDQDGWYWACDFSGICRVHKVEEVDGNCPECVAEYEIAHNL